MDRDEIGILLFGAAGHKLAELSNGMSRA